MSTESSPLLSYRLFRVSGDAEMAGVAQEEAPLVVGSASGGGAPDPARQLSTFFGVIVPTVLSMFSIVVFMRVGRLAAPSPSTAAGRRRPRLPPPSAQHKPRPLGGRGDFPAGGGAQSSPPLSLPSPPLFPGFVVGHAGFLQSLLMLVVAYLIISLTVLSVCAISTNGAVQAGGAYCILWG